MRIIIDADELVKVVRCKDCKNYMEDGASRPHCYEDGRIVMPNDFCSWGNHKKIYEVTK